MSTITPEQLLKKPLAVVQSLMGNLQPAQLQQSGDWGMSDLVVNTFKLNTNTPLLSLIPSLNDTRSEMVAPYSLVRFRGMVQDTLGKEYYDGVYEAVQHGTTNKVLRSGKYQDVPESLLDEPVDNQGPGRMLFERQIINVVEPPGESHWVGEAVRASAAAATTAANASGASESKSGSGSSGSGAGAAMTDDDDSKAAASSSNSSAGAGVAAASSPVKAAAKGKGKKRERDSEDTAMEDVAPATAGAAADGTIRMDRPSAAFSGASAASSSASSSSSSASAFSLSLGGSDDSGDAKMDSSDSSSSSSSNPFAFGAVSADRTKRGRAGSAAARDDTLGVQRHVIRPGGGQNILVKLYDQYAKDDHNQSVFKVGQLVEVIGVLSVTTPWIEGSGEERDELGDYNPPMSRVLRLHCMHMRTLNQGFPLAPVISTPIFDTGIEQLRKNLGNVRGSLVKYIETVLGGDAVAAELVLLHMISRVHMRKDLKAVGKLALNINGLVNSTAAGAQPLARVIHQMYQLLLPRAMLVEVTVNSLNHARWGVWKDHDQGRVMQTPLQVPTGTFLVFDETGFGVGDLNQTGLRNLHTVKQLLSEQTLNYDFGFGCTADWEVDTPALLLSNKKSIFGCDVRHTLKPTQTVAGSLPTVSHELLSMWRMYLLLVRQLKWDLNEDSAKMVRDWFVARRKEYPSTNEETFHSHLLIGRLMSISVTENGLSSQRWQAVQALLSKV